MHDGSCMRRVAVAVCLSCIIANVHPAISAEPEWWLLESPRFTVLSATNEKSTRAWSEEFNQFLDALGKVLTVKEGALPDLTVTMFRSERDFDQFKPLRPDGDVDDNVAGFLTNDGSYSSIAFSSRHNNSVTRRIIYHEAVHWTARGVRESLPMWFEEGMAEVFSTFRMKGSKVMWGEYIVDHIYLLDQVKQLDLEKLLSVSREDPLFDDSTRTAMFYAQSWLFVHHNMFGVGGSLRGLIDYVIKSQTLSRDAAFKEAFGMDYEAMEKALNRYRRGGKFHYHEAPKTPSAVSGTYSKAAPEFVHASLAQLAYAMRRDEQLNQHADALAALQPDSLINIEVQVLQAHRKGESDRLIAAAEQAIKRGSTDARTHFLLASGLMEKYSLEPTPDARLTFLPRDIARRVADLCARTIELFPMYLSAYKLMSWSLLNVEEVTESDATWLQLGLRAYPDVPDIQLGLAVIERRNGDLDLAVQRIQQVGSLLDDGPEVIKGMGRFIDEIWIIDEYQSRIKALLESREVAAANRLLDELELYNAKKSIKTFISVTRQNVAFFEQIFAAETAFEEGRRADARAILEKAKTMEGATPLFKRMIDRTMKSYNLIELDPVD